MVGHGAKEKLVCRAPCRIVLSVCMRGFVVVVFLALFYGRRQFRSSCVGNSVLLG